MPKRSPVAVDGILFVPLTRGCFTVVDIADTALVGDWAWRTQIGRHTLYAVREASDGSVANRYTVLLHRLILGLERDDPQHVDHINRNGLDNRRVNLRAVSPSENHANAPGRQGTTSRYKGVYWNSHNDRWHAEIKASGQRHSLRYHRDEEAAALAYDKAACELWGDLALLNLPVPKP